MKHQCQYDFTGLERVINRALKSARPGDVLRESDSPDVVSYGAKGRHAQRMGAIEGIYLAGIRKVLARAELQVLHKLHHGLTPRPRTRIEQAIAKIKNVGSGASHPVAADFMFNLDDFAEMFFAEMREAGTEALEISGQGLLSELGVDRKYVTPHGLIHDFTIARQNRLGNVPAEVYDTLKSSLEEGIQGGETMDELAQRVQATVGQIDAGRAHTIARTETSSAYNTGRLDSMKQAGFTYKAWLTAHDERVRLPHSHAESDGPIPIEETFSNGLKMPGDPAGAPAEVINCRCVLLAADEPGATT